ncbi:unnamed protein product [Microthlaspi erraticum]|uniref:Malectin-like domain-containing protein n=1 Tax=Microthlaspi erraticum TaxID=1685480 RepID=A0A6D2KHY3_9BRAS|nr:unnamed protein product [Microthlaspi erraticum]
MYGNYDGLNQRPKFDVHLGPNFWTTINLQDPFGNTVGIWVDDGTIKEIIHITTSNSLDFCLVKTGTATPFISALELRPLREDSYTTKAGSLKLIFRQYISDSGSVVRYPEDVHDRVWEPEPPFDWTEVNTTTPVTSTNAFEVPQLVISKAITTKAAAGKSVDMGWLVQNPDEEFHVYVHFAEIQALKPNDTREFDILLSGKTIYKEYRPLPFMVETVPITPTKCEFICNLELVRTKVSSLPPLLNAVEVYGALPLPQSDTHESDVNAIKNIQATYKLQKISWQGDPCVPVHYMWAGLNCSNTIPSTPPRIIYL